MTSKGPTHGSPNSWILGPSEIRPRFDPDGSDLVLSEDQWLRSTVRPLDENEDGIADSDPPMDLDGDGRILQMRVPHPEGEWRKDSQDPRIMVRREAGDTGPFYRLEREGIDGNGDGRIASDGVGRIDMNRNFPRNWERAHIQDSGGAFPLSEPETYPTVEFIDAHRIIYSIYHGHTSGGFVFRPTSAMNPDSLDRADLDLIVHLGDYYTGERRSRLGPGEALTQPCPCPSPGLPLQVGSPRLNMS